MVKEVSWLIQNSLSTHYNFTRSPTEVKYSANMFLITVSQIT